MGLDQLVNLVRASKHLCKRQTQLSELRLSLLCMCISCLRITQVCYPAGICVSSGQMLILLVGGSTEQMPSDARWTLFHFKQLNLFQVDNHTLYGCSCSDWMPLAYVDVRPVLMDAILICTIYFGYIHTLDTLLSLPSVSIHLHTFDLYIFHSYFYLLVFLNCLLQFAELLVS